MLGTLVDVELRSLPHVVIWADSRAITESVYGKLNRWLAIGKSGLHLIDADRVGEIVVRTSVVLQSGLGVQW